jgi:hypothetical protein
VPGSGVVAMGRFYRVGMREPGQEMLAAATPLRAEVLADEELERAEVPLRKVLEPSS